MNVIAYPDKPTRDRVFADLRSTGNHLERQAVKFTDDRLLLNPEVPGEIVTDEKGRARFQTFYCVAYPRH